MGYRSKVALALTSKGVGTLENRLASSEICEEVRKRIQEFLDHPDKHTRDEDTGQEAWYWDSLKWYTDDPVHFPDVDFIEKLLSEMPYGDYRFIRIGEDYDDTEMRGAFWESSLSMEVVKYINFSVGL